MKNGECDTDKFPYHEQILFFAVIISFYYMNVSRYVFVLLLQYCCSDITARQRRRTGQTISEALERDRGALQLQLSVNAGARERGKTFI